MLNVDPEKRITAGEALMNHFITKPNICRGINAVDPWSTAFTPFRFMRLLWQLEDLSKEFKSLLKSRDDPFSAYEEKHFCTNSEPSAEAGTTDSTTAGAGQRPSHTKKAASHVSPNHYTDTSGDEGTTGFVEVKSRKKYWERICKFFKEHQGKNRPAGKTGLDDTASAGTYEKPLNANTTASRVDLSNNTDSSMDEVRPRRKDLKSMCKFFTRMFKSETLKQHKGS
ncbi:hypothetical protein Q5P01_019935 [Channa striata]|uniref:Uncharacterized protein n=1 Tax=Channa striata TaxID=64152 RepID=A0AA88M2L8_CHASR|nr:hypothetical protein Q5P01_019935 [Channa striata]